ncbi:MAG: hypothetical protein ACYTGC_11980, partial [Planctomycetota bacterium]
MKATRFERIESLFHAARALPATDRAGFLDEECNGDLPLRREIESLLSHTNRPTRAMDALRQPRGGET